jgi:hypothetical protein
MQLADSSRPAARPDLVQRQVEEDFFLYDPIADKVILLNASAALIFDLCDGTRTPDQIAEDMARLFESDLSRVAGDVRETLAEFATSGLLSKTSDDPAKPRVFGDGSP